MISTRVILSNQNEQAGIYYKLGIQATCIYSGESVRVFGNKRHVELIPEAKKQLQEKLNKLSQKKDKNNRLNLLQVWQILK